YLLADPRGHSFLSPRQRPACGSPFRTNKITRTAEIPARSPWLCRGVIGQDDHARAEGLRPGELQSLLLPVAEQHLAAAHQHGKGIASGWPGTKTARPGHRAHPA